MQPDQIRGAEEAAEIFSGEESLKCWYLQGKKVLVVVLTVV